MRNQFVTIAIITISAVIPPGLQSPAPIGRGRQIHKYTDRGTEKPLLLLLYYFYYYTAL